jgi:hypothetical protein
MKMIEELKGKTITQINIVEDVVKIICSDGTEYKFEHEQDCCEEVCLVNDYTKVPELPAYFQEVFEDCVHDENDYGTETYSTYHLYVSTGTVILRWHGESNGYYDEGVSFQRLMPDGIWRSFYYNN